MTIRIRAATISGCRSIKGPETILLPEAGLVRLTGQDVRTKGSSGAGKSSIMHGIMYGLGCCDVPATQLRSFAHLDADLSVSLDLTDGDKKFTLNRSSRGVSITGDLQSTGQDGVSKTLASLFSGCDIDTVKAISYRAQDSDSTFLGMNDQDRKEFLAHIIPALGRFEAAESIAIDAAKDLEVKLAYLEGELILADSAVAHAQVALDGTESVSIAPTAVALAEVENRKGATSSLLAAERGRLVAIDSEVTETYRQQFAELDEEIDRLRNEQRPARDTARLDQLRTLQLGCQERLRRAREDDERRRSLSDTEVSNLCTEIARIDRALERREGAHASLLAAQRSLSELEADRCPTCAREWDRARTELNRVRGSIAELTDQLQELSALEGRRETLRVHLDSVPLFEPSPSVVALTGASARLSGEELSEVQRLDVLDQEWSDGLRRRTLTHTDQRSALVTRLEGEKASRRETVLTNVDRLSKLLDSLRDDEMRLVRQKTAIEASQEIRRELTGRLASSRQKAAEVQQKRDDVRLALAAEKDFAALVGKAGFLGLIFDEILSEIAEETNTVLAATPNTAASSVQFRSEKVAKNGKVKRSIAASVCLGGTEIDLKNGPSGGQRSVIRLAVDLALMRVVERRSGVRVGWLLLDEPFNGLGTVEKEAVMDMLRDVARDKTVLVIDHATESQDAFDQTIEMTYDGVVSRVNRGG